jgi:hypothetical protein
MPEILGFNLHFEGVAYETLVTARELEELGYSPFYSLLHVSIDNLHSGHSAIALRIVTEYLDRIEQETDARNLQVTWNRVKAGYLLSRYLIASINRFRYPVAASLNLYEKAVMNVIAGKARVAQKMHCRSRIKIGGHHLSHWLDKDRLREPTWQIEFIRALSNTADLVRKGHSLDSKLVKQLSWGGKMFGAFTDLEVKAIRQWIDAMFWTQSKSYWTFTGLCANDVPYDPLMDTQSWTNAFYEKTPLIEQALRDSNDIMFPFHTIIAYPEVKQGPDLSKLIPLWFASLGLLENFVCVPSKVANNRSCAILKVLRAQHGFREETEGVSGMDESLRSGRVDLIDIGLHLMEKAGLQRPQSVNEVLQEPNATFARELATLAVRPEEHASVLIGFSCAFTELHLAMVDSVSSTLQDTLQQIASREQRGLEEWLTTLQKDSIDYFLMCKAYNIGGKVIMSCFN